MEPARIELAPLDFRTSGRTNYPKVPKSPLPFKEAIPPHCGPTVVNESSGEGWIRTNNALSGSHFYRVLLCLFVCFVCRGWQAIQVYKAVSFLLLPHVVFKFPMTVRTKQLTFFGFSDELVPATCETQLRNVELFVIWIFVVKFQRSEAFVVSTMGTFSAKDFHQLSFSLFPPFLLIFVILFAACSHTSALAGRSDFFVFHQFAIPAAKWRTVVAIFSSLSVDNLSVYYCSGFNFGITNRACFHALTEYGSSIF